MVDAWTGIFEKDTVEKNLTYPSGYGPSNALHIFLNGFESYTVSKQRNRFILSVTNEKNYFDIIRSSHILEPGNIYKLKVVTNQITTTKKFDAMYSDYRKCNLTKDSSGMRHFSEYSKRGCELECGWVISE